MDAVITEPNPREAATASAGELLVERDVLVAMRDGVRLAADIYRPAKAAGPLPVLMERTPYDKRGVNHGDRTAADPSPLSKPEIAARLARHGYAVLVQDCRGRYGSEGVFAKYVNEAEDGADTLAWLLRQAWCDGRVGTFGLSYGAHVQSALACLDPPGLAAMFLDCGGFSSAFHSGIRQGGAFELKQATWAYKHAIAAAEPAARARLEEEDIGEALRHPPWLEGRSPLRCAPEYERYLLGQWRSGRFDESWRAVGLYAAGRYAAFSDVPMVHMASWYDPYARSAVENFTALSKLKRGPVKLVLGPWTHGQRSVSYSGDVDFGAEARFDGHVGEDYFKLRLAWFDHCLKGEGADPLPEPVRFFRMGGGGGRRNADGRLDHGGVWKTAADWPPPGAEPVAYFLRADGGLSLQPSAESLQWLGYIADPARPVPTIGGAVASGAPVMEAGAFDQRETADLYGAQSPGRAIADRDDVLVFQTEPLTRDLDVTGPVEAELWISSSAPDTDFHIKLIDVHPPSDDYPQGYAMNLATGVLRARYRGGFEQERWLEPGEVHHLKIEAFPTSNLFVRGHRLRLDVSSSNFPHFDVNPNSGEPEGLGRHPQRAHNRIYVDGTRASHLRLSVVAHRGDAREREDAP